MTDLIYLEDYKDIKGISPTSTKEDSRINILIEVASQQVQSYCGRDFLGNYTQDKTEVFTIRDNTTSVALKELPIKEVSTVEIKSGDSFTAVTDFFVDKEIGLVYRNAKFKYFPKGPSAVRVAYKGGYENVDTIPMDLKMAVVYLVDYMKKDEHIQRRVINSTSLEGVVNLRLRGFPDHIARLLQTYKIHD